MRSPCALLALFTLLTACSGSHEETHGGSTQSDPSETAPAGATPTTVDGLRRETGALLERAEHDAAEVEVIHILVSFQGAPRMDPNKVTRSREEAEQLAAQLLDRIRAGEDFDGLRKEYSNDTSQTGVYTLRTSGGDGMTSFNRSSMAGYFGDVSWRLPVDEVGVTPYDPDRSPYGWHIIKRLK